MKMINSSLISWFAMQGSESEDFLNAYCADGDGLVQLVELADRFILDDQGDICKEWLKPDNPPLSEMLELAQSYLAATYHEIFEDAMHYNNVDERDAFNSINGIKGE